MTVKMAIIVAITHMCCIALFSPVLRCNMMTCIISHGIQVMMTQLYDVAYQQYRVLCVAWCVVIHGVM